MKLTDIKIRNLKPEKRVRRYSDGQNLFVEVKPSGTKLWKMAYTFQGKQKTLSFGVYPATSLALARQRKKEAKALLATGVDPMQKAKQDREERAALEEHTFRNIAAELIQKLEREGKAETTLAKKKWLIGMACVHFGDTPIRNLSASSILPCLKEVEAKGNYETAKRLRSTIGQVCRFAVATARADDDPTQALRGALIAPKVKHMAAMTDRRGFAEVVRAIWDYDGSSLEIRTALKLMALSFPRPIELRQAVWSEFDLSRKIWTIPAERMKSRRQHAKPLSGLSTNLLLELRADGQQQELVFASALAKGRPISENTLNGALRRMGFTKSEMTSHGFRASASSLLNESGKWNEDAIEAELAHRGADQVRRTYNRSRYWDERTEMMEWWSNEIETMLHTACN